MTSSAADKHAVKKGAAWWMLQFTGWLLAGYLAYAQLPPAFDYQLGVRMGTQEPASQVTEVGVALSWGFAFADLVVYVPLLVVGLIGHFIRSSWGRITLAAALGMTAYWPLVALATVFAARDAPGWDLPKEQEYGVVLPLIAFGGAWGIWQLVREETARGSNTKGEKPGAVEAGTARQYPLPVFALDNFAPDISSKVKRVGAGISIIVFPVMLLAGFVTHPNLLSLEMVRDVDVWVSEWRGNALFHLGHLMVMFAVPFIIVAIVHLMSTLKGDGVWYGVVGGGLAVFGAFMLAVDKGARTFVLTAFKDLPDAEFEAISPALNALFNREGWLWITWGFITLPIGFVLLVIGLLKERSIPEWQGFCMIAGLLLLINPDIELVSSVGAVLMCIGYVPLGWRTIVAREPDPSEIG